MKESQLIILMGFTAQQQEITCADLRALLTAARRDLQASFEYFVFI
jgi:hypothetical protein